MILTGFMGTGKTTVGRILAEALGYEFVDTDAVIEGRHGPIPSIFFDEGEAAFRDIERRLAVELARRHSLVIATGGRMMLDEANAEVLGDGGRVFCLVAGVGEIFERVMSDRDGPQRPLLAGADPRDRIAELLAERQEGYCRFQQIVTDGRAPEAVASQIAAMLDDV